MCLIVFGSQIKTINDIPIRQDLRNLADSLRDAAASLLAEGCVITATSPLKLVTPEPPRRLADQRSVAGFCRDFLSGRIGIEGRPVGDFHSRLTRLRERFSAGDIVRLIDWDPPQTDFDSDGSFQGRKLKMVVLPRKMVFRDGFSDEEDTQKKKERSWSSEYSSTETAASDSSD
jgi:hypothetical protein